MPILEALISLLKFQRKATIAEIARISGKKQKDVLDTLNNNLMYILHSKKNSSIIVGFDTQQGTQVERFLKKYKYYSFNPAFENVVGKDFSVTCYHPEYKSKWATTYFDYHYFSQEGNWLKENGFQHIEKAPFIHIHDLWIENGNDICATNTRARLRDLVAPL